MEPSKNRLVLGRLAGLVLPPRWLRTVSMAALALVFTVAGAAHAQSHLGAERRPAALLDLYPGVAPGSEGWTRIEKTTNEGPTRGRMVRNVVTPTIEVFLPDSGKATGAAVIIAPGGGFRFLGYDYEGVWVAQWLAAKGVAGIVLKYRVGETSADDAVAFARPPPPPPGTPAANPGLSSAAAELATADGLRAMTIVRERAAGWGIDPARIGFMGFSAGARVAVGVVAEGGAPAFAAPIYGGAFGSDLKFPANVPPMFLAVATDDRLAASTVNSLYSDLFKAGENPELHAYHTGGHGFGLQPRTDAASHWIDEFYWWVESNGWLKPASPPSRSPAR